MTNDILFCTETIGIDISIPPQYVVQSVALSDPTQYAFINYNVPNEKTVIKIFEYNNIQYIAKVVPLHLAQLEHENSKKVGQKLTSTYADSDATHAVVISIPKLFAFNELGVLVSRFFGDTIDQQDIIYEELKEVLPSIYIF